MARDTRLVQTAVIGDEHSDVPIVLPSEAIELDLFRRSHGQDTFWCGLLLGGCGGRLSDKLYTDRQCHFQHYPLPDGAPNTCRRPKVGESSADHLYVKSAMSQSLLDSGRVARFAFPPPIGSLVDVDLEEGTSLRIYMDDAVPPDWTEQRAVILGPGLVPASGTLARCPYVYRVRCESAGATRRVWIGTQALAHPTEWVPLSECTWTDHGLLTPAASRILRERPAAGGQPTPVQEPSVRRGALPESVLTFIRGLEAAQRTGTVEHVRRLCNGSSAFLENLVPQVRAEADTALSEARQWLATHEEYQRRLFDELDTAVRQGRTWDVRSRLQHVAALTRRGASASEQRILAAARAYLRKHDYADETRSEAALRRGNSYNWAPPAKKRKLSASAKKAKRRREAAEETRWVIKRLRKEGHLLSYREFSQLVGKLSQAAVAAGESITDRERETVAMWQRKAQNPRRQASNAAQSHKEPEAARTPTVRAGGSQLDPLSAAVKSILEKAASTGTTLTWAQIREQLPPGLPSLERREQTSILIRVDRSRGSGEPLLSALITGADHDMHPAYPGIAATFGRLRTQGNLEAIAQWVVEVSRFQRGRTH